VPKSNPYSAGAHRVLTSVYEIYDVYGSLPQDDRVFQLVRAMVEVYSFAESDEILAQTMQQLERDVIEITKQTLECAVFLHEYTGHVFAGTAIFIKN
jgi:hypothetical protein